MSYALAKIEQKVKQSLRQLWKNDKHLLSVDASERSITHRLAIYLKKEFKDLDVDCEYNRAGNDTKTCRQPNETATCAEGTEARAVIPDIIVHRRGTNGDNLLVIEVKKLMGNPTGIDSIDKGKLRAFLDKNQLSYRYGLALQIPVGGGNTTARLFWFEQGADNPSCEEDYDMGNDG